MRKIIFEINGGIGKCVAATAVIKAIKKQYPDSCLIVVSGWPIVFWHNPNVDHNVAFSDQKPGFYERYIHKTEPLPIYLLHEPYRASTCSIQEPQKAPAVRIATLFVNIFVSLSKTNTPFFVFIIPVCFKTNTNFYYLKKLCPKHTEILSLEFIRRKG